MSRRKYSDFKNDPVVKVPVFAWLFDKWEFYVAIIAVAVFVVGGFLNTNIQSLQRILAAPVEETEFQAITAMNTIGTNWAKSLVSENPHPEIINEWNPSDSQKPQKTKIPNCVFTEKSPTSLLATTSATGNGIETNIHVYGAGQSAKEFNNIIKLAKDCNNLEVSNSDFGAVARGSGVFLISIGDAIISVTHPESLSSDHREQLIAFYVNRAKETLVETQCVSLLVSEADAARSFFYNADSFTGLTENKELKTNVDFSGLPRVSGIESVKINTPGLELPEAPLPDGFPQMPEEVSAQPVIPTTPQDREAFDGVATYKVADKLGPGCGWDWSAQIAPATNEKSLKSEKSKSISDKQKELDEQANIYIQEKMDWAISMFSISSQLDKWNKYAQKVNQTHDKWNWLNNERINLYQPWINYVDSHRAWEQFDANKASALNAYKEELKKCQDEQSKLTEWEKQYGDKESEKDKESTEKIPERPAGCTKIPDEPEILKQEKPEEPQAPAIPEGVTIPNSWPKV